MMYTIRALMHGRLEYVKCDNENAARLVLAALLAAGYHAEASCGMRVL
jgi:DNA-binding LacI/PurR family transcriptional regulator